MNIVDKFIEPFFPERVLKRVQARSMLRYYEAAKPGRLRKRVTDSRKPSELVREANTSLVAQARHLDRNHDIARGILNVLVANIIGSGLQIEPMVKDKKGNLAKSVNEQISNLLYDWYKFPEVTNEHSFAQVQRLACRAWLRDGEIFSKMITGLRDDLDHVSTIPFSIEMIETDYLPYGIDTPEKGVHDGIKRDAWGRPASYYVRKRGADDSLRGNLLVEYSPINANDMVHCKFVDRFLQNRGVTVFASVITRLEDIKDYEESERIAAKIAACLAAVVKKGSPDLYQGDSDNEPRTIRMEAGKIIDDLLVGESVEMMDSKRPNPNLETFRQGQVKAVSSGTMAGYSSISKSYDSTYAAQRQEMLEQSVHYSMLRDDFSSHFIAPIHRRAVQSAITAEKIKVGNIDQSSLFDFECFGEGLPWLDPWREARAEETFIKLGLKSKIMAQRERGGNPMMINKQILQERQEDDSNGLVFTGDAKHEIKQ